MFTNNLRWMSGRTAIKTTTIIRPLCDFRNILPTSLRGPITWKQLPASPFDPDIIASYQCGRSKEKFLLGYVDNKLSVVRNADRAKVFTFEDNKIPHCWKMQGLDKNGKIARPPTP